MLKATTESIYRYPPLNLLTASQSSAYASELSEKALLQANDIVNSLHSFGVKVVKVELKNVYCGAAITMYDFHPITGTTIHVLNSNTKPTQYLPTIF